MPRGNSKESQRWAYRVSSILFPVAKYLDADADRGGELDLRKPHKPAQSRHVRTRVKVAADKASSKTRR